MNQPKAADALRLLAPLVGEWTVELTPPDGAGPAATGHTSIAWHESRAHLVVRQGMSLGGTPTSVAIIGCDAGNGTYTQLYSDDRGVCRTYDMTITESEWTLRRDGDPFPQRFVATLAGDVINGRWERGTGAGGWELDFHLTYRRAVSAK
jgi:hypothetical protein